MSPRDHRSRLVVHFNKNHNKDTLHRPQSEHPKDEEEPWAYYQPESSPIFKNNEPSTLKKTSYSGTANKPPLPKRRALEVDHFGIPECGNKFNLQTTTSLSLRQALVPKGMINVMNS